MVRLESDSQILPAVTLSKHMAAETERTKPVAVFMAFGTQGDAYPIAAISAAFACDQRQYHVVFVTHSAHENLTSHLKERHVAFLSIRSPPVLSIPENHDDATGMQDAFSLKKQRIILEHRQECYSAVEASLGHGPSMEGDFILINFFALEGWSLAELFHVRCVLAAPYVVPYSAPSTFESHFRRELPHLYKCLVDSPTNKVCWKDVIHWMWPLFTENWGSWRIDDLNLSPCPFTDPVTGHPMWHDLPPSPLLLYGFSKEIVECPDYWPSNVCVCGFWFLPIEWQFSCKKCGEICASSNMIMQDELCPAHLKLSCFLKTPTSEPPVFVGLSSVGSMGFLRNPHAFLQIIQTVLEITSYRFILFTAGYEPLDEAISVVATRMSSFNERQYNEEGICLSNGRLFCFSGMIPYKWLFPRCAAALHHGGSGSTAAALHAGIPQVICPFMLDQFYWAEKMHWIGVAPEPLKRKHLAPEKLEAITIRVAANVLSRAIDDALSPKIKARASEIAKTISLEDGVMEAVKILKQEMNCPN